MAELYSSSNIPAPSGGVGGTTDDNEPRIDGDGQEVNSLRFLGAGAPAPQILGTGPGGTAPQNPPASSITPSTAISGGGGGGGGVGGVSQPLQNQQQPHPPPPSQTPHQQVVSHNLNQSVVSSQGVPNTPLGVGVGAASSYDPYDPSRGQPTSYGGAPAMQMPSGPAGPYAAAMAGQMAMMMAPGGYPGGYAPMGMAPMYPSPFNPYGGYPGMMAPQPQPQPQQPSFSQAELSARLQVLRVQNPTYYREWYKKYEAYRSNPRRYQFPQIEVPIPGFPPMGGPGSSQTLPARYGRSRKESTRSSVNGDPYRERHHHHPNDSLLDYTSLPHNNSSISRGHPHHHPRPHSSGRASVNGTLPPPEDDFDGDGAPGGGGGGGVNSLTADMSNLNLLGQISNSSFHHPLNSTLNSQYQQQHPPGGDGSGGSGRGETQSGRSSTIGEPYPAMVQRDIYGGYPQDMQGGYGGMDRYPPGGGGGVDSRFGFQPISREATPPPRGRTTPMKFSTFHCIATMTPLGHMIRIRNGGAQQQVLEFVKMRQLVGHLPEFREMEGFPGPLTQQLTHKSTVIQFCKRKIKEARSNPAQVDRNNYVLLWEFLMLMLRQNGMVVGSDIAELLLTTVQQQKQEEQERRAAALQILEEQQQQVINNRDSIVEGSDGTSMDGGEDGNSGVEKEEGEGESSGGEEDSTSQKLPPPPPTAPPRDENKLVEEFCSHLLEGHKKDALEFAMDNGLWGHALFFASKMDERSYGHVLARFANGIPLHSPLQTLYHIMCGKQPASVTNCGDVMEADESSSAGSMTFGDWKPHLAMLLSNSGYKPDVERRAILTLGDTLHSRNHVFAAQFCYLMGLEEFSKQSRLGTLLGYSKESKNVLEATQMTEVYEFARKLADPGFSLGVSFLQSKLEYGRRLVSYGFVEEALAYCEEITKVLKQSKIGGGGNFGVGEDSDQELISLCVNTLNIAERIAAADENGTAAQTWVDELRRMAMGEGGEDVVRRVSMLGENDSSSGGSISNQEYAPSYATSQQSQQALYSSSLPPAIGGGGELPQTSAPTFYDPNSGQQLSTGQGQDQGQSAINQQQQQQVDGALNEMGGYGGGQEVQQDSNSWGVSQQQQQQQPMMNGGLHLSQPQQNPPQQQQQQQQPMYDPSQMYGGGEQTVVGGGYQQQQQQPAVDGANSIGMGGYGGGDKFTNAGGNTGNSTTINNNNWYSPYDQPSTGTGPTGGHDYSKGNQYQQQQQQPPNHNSSPVKLTSAQKKSVRFVEDASKQTAPHPPPTTTAAQVVEGDNHNHDKSVKENGNSVSGGDVGGGGLRARNVGGGNRVDPIDLKSALKNRQRERQQVAGLGVSVVNGGGGGGGGGSSNGGGGGGDSFDNLEDDLEGQGRICGGVGGFEVEFKSTYPIDEPISHHQINNRLPSPNVQTIAQQQQQQMKLVNRKAQIRNINLTAAQQPMPKPPPQPQHNQQISSNHLPESRTVPSSSQGGGGGFGRRKTYPVDKECCTVNQPCEDHEDFLEDEEDEDEDLDVDDEDEEGGIGGDNGNGVENGGNNDGGEDGGRYPNHLQHYTRCENKTENNQQPLSTSPSSPSAAKKDDKKKGKDGGGGQQQEKGWFSGLFKVLKPKNQMILPDDKNPTIVWDDKQKRWVNTVGDGEDETAPAGPPPKDSDLMRPPPQMPMSNGPQNPPPPPGGMGGAYQQQPPQQQQPAYNNLQQNSLPNPSQLQSQGGMGNMMGVPSNTTLNNNNSSNKYKLQKGRALKGYVDVLNPNGPTPATSPSSNSIPPMGGIPGANPSAAPPNMFIPPPMPSSGGGAGGHGGEMDGGNVSFLTPAPITQLADDPNSQQDISHQAPPMFNPAQFHQGYPQQGQ